MRRLATGNTLGIQQAELFNLVLKSTNIVPPVIDADDLSTDPKAVLTALCSSLQINFSPKMLNWEKGPHHYDGIWGQYWYTSLNKTTSFKEPNTVDISLTDHQKQMISDVYPYFQILKRHKLKF